MRVWLLLEFQTRSSSTYILSDNKYEDALRNANAGDSVALWKIANHHFFSLEGTQDLAPAGYWALTKLSEKGDAEAQRRLSMFKATKNN